MKPQLFNALMWLNRPTIQTAIIGIALLLVSTYVTAVELIVIHDPQCYYCKQFQNGAAQTYDQSPHADWISLTTVNYSDGFQKTRDKWPTWFSEAFIDGRIKGITGTPTFILYDSVKGEDKSREIGRFVGYGGEEQFYTQMEHYRVQYEEWKKTH